jgi:nicotinate phosphoribosyltransferase
MSEEKGGSANVSSCVGALLTDLYQLSMGYAYWKTGKQDQHAVFDLFFRKNPFKGLDIS